MATFSSLFNFPDLLTSQSELSSPPNSSDSECSTSEASEDEEDT